MSEAFLKALKWYIIALAAIVGTSAFIIASNSGSVKPVMLGVFGYGVVYGMSMYWKDLSKKLLLASLIVFLSISFVSSKIPIVVYILLGYNLTAVDPYNMWGLAMAAIGIPIMTAVFYFYD